MDERKVAAVRDWPVPKSIKDLQRFLGFANFYRRFIQDFISTVHPLTDLLRGKPKSLSWSPLATEAFKQLKDQFSSAPLLRQTDPSQPFVVEVDASSFGVVAVLSQRQGDPAVLHPCAFYSHKLTLAECNYNIGDCELLAIKLALEEWRHWLEGAQHPFAIFTDHKNLQYLREAKRLNPRLACWAMFFTRFNFQISYSPGSKNSRADALSRMFTLPEETATPQPILPENIFISPITWKEDEAIASANVPNARPPGCLADRTYVPMPLCNTIQSVHSSLGTGHSGANETLSLVHQHFWWSGMAADVRRFVLSCGACAMSKTPHRLPEGKLEPPPVPRRPWHI